MKKPWFIVTDYNHELREHVAVLNGVSNEIGFGKSKVAAIEDLLIEINRGGGVDGSQYRWSQA